MMMMMMITIKQVGCSNGKVANVLDYNIVASEFEH